MLYFCAWEDATSFIIDASDEATARNIATEHASKAPKRVRPFPPNTFALEVLWTEDDEDDGELLNLDPLEHVADIIDDFEEEAEMLPAVQCMAEADIGESNEVVKCEREAGHDGKHEATTSEGEFAQW